MLERLRRWWARHCPVCSRHVWGRELGGRLAQPITVPPGKHYVVFEAKVPPRIVLEGSEEAKAMETTLPGPAPADPRDSPAAPMRPIRKGGGPSPHGGIVSKSAGTTGTVLGRPDLPPSPPRRQAR